MSKFSVITTTYKHEKFIWATIESVLAQDFSDWELLIWDDSPDDATWKIIQEYIEKYPDKIRAWRHSPNKWIVENTNFLLSKASKESEYITFLEGDDCFVSSSLSRKYEIFTEYPDVALVYSDMDFINAEWKITLHRRIQSNKTRFYQNEIIPVDAYINAKSSLIISYSTVAIRKSVLDPFLPIESLTVSKTYSVSDYDLFFRIGTQHQVYGISDSLTLYRRHAWNASSGYDSLFQDLTILLNTYEQRGYISHQTYTKKVAWISLMQSITALSRWEKKVALKFLLSAFWYNLFQDIIFRCWVVIFLMLPKNFVKQFLYKRMRSGE